LDIGYWIFIVVQKLFAYKQFFCSRLGWCKSITRFGLCF